MTITQAKAKRNHIIRNRHHSPSLSTDRLLTVRRQNQMCQEQETVQQLTHQYGENQPTTSLLHELPINASTLSCRATASKAVPIAQSSAIPMASTSPAKQQPEKEPNILMRHVILDQKTLQAIVEHADQYVSCVRHCLRDNLLITSHCAVCREFLEVDRSLAGVIRDDPEDPNNIDFVYVQDFYSLVRCTLVVFHLFIRCSNTVRSVDINLDTLRIGGLPKSALTDAEGVVSALALEAIPVELLTKLHGVSMRVAQAADSIALRDTGTPIVAAFSKAKETKGGK
jgi:hypothetical protein